MRFPKGHKVIFAYPCTNDYKSWLSSEGVSFTEDDDKLFIECFVSGDDPKIGLSIVSLDNPKFCVYFADAEIKGRDVRRGLVREMVAQGYENSSVLRYIGKAESIIPGPVSCPY